VPLIFAGSQSSLFLSAESREVGIAMKWESYFGKPGLTHGTTGKWKAFDTLSDERLFLWLDAEFKRNPKSERTATLLEEEERRGGIEKRYSSAFHEESHVKKLAEEERERRRQYYKDHQDDQYCGDAGSTWVDLLADVIAVGPARSRDLSSGLKKMRLGCKQSGQTARSWD